MTKASLSSESAEQISVIEWCDVVKIPIVHIANESKRSVAYASMLKRMGMRKGFPDLFIPRARYGYHELFIEMKYSNNKPGPEQMQWLTLLKREGYLCAVCYSAQKAIELIKKYDRSDK